MPMRSPESSRVPLYAALLVTTVSLLLGFSYAAVVTQHAAGIFSQGQARWMQSHVRAVMYLHRYARRGEPAALESAREAMRLPAHFQRARQLLARPRPDTEGAVAAFMAGGLPRVDAERAAAYARIFRSIPRARPVLDSWNEGDRLFVQLATIGDSLAAAHARGDSSARAALITGIERTDDALAREEQIFAAGLADISRVIPPIVLGVGVLFGALLVFGCVFTVRKVARAADRARAAQLENFSRLHSLMEGVPDLIAWLDRDRRYTYVNDAMERLCGIPREQIIGLTPRALAARVGVAESFVETWEAGLARSLDGQADVEMVIELPGAGGGTQVYQFRLAEQRAADGGVESVMAVGRDITALRASEQALREREMQLQHAQKMEAVGRLAGGVAHEFNNILTAVTANIELALLDLGEESETHRELLDALAAARRAGGLTRQLLVFGRRDAVETRRVDLGRLVAELEPMLQRLAGGAIPLITAQRTEHAFIMGNAGQLQQILFNLVSNARDAMPEGGTMQIEVGAAQGAELRRNKAIVSGDVRALASAADSPWVTLTVRDTGIGMPPTTVERLFEPFFTTKGPGAGSGLGLPVVNGIMVQLGGCIVVETEPGTGTAVTVAFPAVAPEAEPDDCPDALATAALFGSARASEPSGTGERVLLVEDEAPVRAAARRMLEQAGYHVVEAKHAEDALLQWDRAPADIVVTDFMMPGLNGAELLARLRTLRPALPALIVSGYTGGNTIDVSALGEGTGLLQKPFSRADLLGRVRELLDQAAAEGARDAL